MIFLFNGYGLGEAIPKGGFAKPVLVGEANSSF